jgi:hypothetical protein
MRRRTRHHPKASLFPPEHRTAYLGRAGIAGSATSLISFVFVLATNIHQQRTRGSQSTASYEIGISRTDHPKIHPSSLTAFS